MKTVSESTDTLLDYLQSNENYDNSYLTSLLNTKIVIKKEHVSNMKYVNFNIIKLFGKYGYDYTNDDYLMLVMKDERFLNLIPEDVKTYEFYKLVVQSNGLLLQYVPEWFQAPDLCVLAIKNNRDASKFIPKYLLACMANVDHLMKNTNLFMT